jgi:hypothetical protein
MNGEILNIEKGCCVSQLFFLLKIKNIKVINSYREFRFALISISLQGDNL